MGEGIPKQFLEISGTPILVRTLQVLRRTAFVRELILVAPSDYVEETELLLGRFGLPRYQKSLADEKPPELCLSIVKGGAERQESVLNALKSMSSTCPYVLIHDGVRPFVSLRLLEDTWKAAISYGAAIAAVPATDTVKRVCDHKVLETLSREKIWLVQTPQVFRREVIMEAYGAARKHGWTGTDDAALVERIGHPVAVVMGERSNIKVTTPEDLRWAEWFIGDQSVSGTREQGRT